MKLKRWPFLLAILPVAGWLTVAAYPAHATVNHDGTVFVTGSRPTAGTAAEQLTRNTARNPGGWIVRPGQNLTLIAASAYGNSSLWPALWWTNRSAVKNPNLILAGQVLALSQWHPRAAWLDQAAWKATGASDPVSASTDGDTSEAPVSAPVAAPVAAAVNRPAGGGNLSYGGLEQLWISAGGNPGAAATAACIAERESSGVQYATGPYGERGYWQINPVNGSLSTYDAYGNARAAIVLSGNGTNWSAWTTAPMCGV